MSENKNPVPPAAPVDENQIIAERRGKLTALRTRGMRIQTISAATPSPATCMRVDALANEELEARRSTSPSPGDDAEARDGQGMLCHASGHVRTHPALRDADAMGAEALDASALDLATSSAPRDAVQTKPASFGEGDAIRLLRKRCVRCPKNSTA